MTIAAAADARAMPAKIVEPCGEHITMSVSFKDLQEAFEFVCAAGGGEHQAFLGKRSGKITCHSELVDDLDSLPDDIDDPEKFLPIPDRRDLGLGKTVALELEHRFSPLARHGGNPRLAPGDHRGHGASWSGGPVPTVRRQYL